MKRAAVALLAAACAAGSDGPTDSDSDPGAAACPAAGATRVLASGFDRSGTTGTFGTEGATFSADGVPYITARETLETLDADGTATLVEALPASIGLTWWDGAVWGTANQDGDGEEAHALVEVVPGSPGIRHEIQTSRSLNFITPTPWGTLLVADPGTDGIDEWVPGATSLVPWAAAADIASPNGMSFSPDGGTLYVAHTFRDAGLTAITVDGEAAGSIARVVEYPATDAPDGIATAADGSVFITLNTGNRVDVYRDGQVSVLTTETRFPASIAFGRGAWDPCEAVVTSLFSGDVFAVQTGVEGFFPDWETP